ncbi:hypothetical protein [Terrabacter terrigena]|uniref:Uncharacterized protein n=1 Tax=Terrabacter terrigena TaxID=574718 RepID=A0ABW3MXA0_9MICO
MGRRRRSEEWWANHPEVLRCTAHYKSNGKQCAVEATPGTNVCNQHGALIPAVQAKAATRIGMSVDDAVKRLQGMLDDPGVDARDKIKILHDLLDRGGLGATGKHLVAIATQDPVEKLFQDLLSTPGMLREPGQIPAASAPSSVDEDVKRWNAEVMADDEDDVISDIVDAEVVEETPRLPNPPARQRPAGTKPVTPPHIRDALARLL